MSTLINFHGRKQQQGTVLVLSLAILSVLTLVAVTGMKTSVTEERMSGNIRSQEFAMQAAERALFDAINAIDNIPSEASLSADADGRLSIEGVEPDYFDPDTWADGSGLHTEADIFADGQVDRVPRWVFKYVGRRDVCGGSGSLDPSSVFNKFTDCQVSAFRITGHGTGLSPNSTKLIQAYYQRQLLP